MTAPGSWSPALHQTVDRVLPGATPDAGSDGDVYRAVPSARRAQGLVPARDRQAAAAAIRGYGRLQPRLRGLVRRLAAPVVVRAMDLSPDRDTISVPVAGGLRAHLEHMLELSDLKLAVPIRRVDPHSKPTVQVLDATGRTIAFCKLGTGQAAERLRLEADALRRLGRRPRSRVRVPELLHSGDWQDRRLVVMTPVPAAARRLRPAELAATWPRLLDLQGSPTWQSLGHGAWVARARQRVERLGDMPGTALSSVLSTTLDAVLSAHGDTQVLFGEAHGDWTPWNLARHGNHLWCWDLEHSASDVPFGVDVVQGLVLLEQHIAHMPLDEACRRAVATSVSVLPTLGLSRRTAGAVIAAGLWDFVARACEVRGPAKLPDRGWQPGVDQRTLVQVLHSVTTLPRQAPRAVGGGRVRRSDRRHEVAS